MIPEQKLRLSLKELSLKGRTILAQQSETSYEKAFQQAQLLRKISKVKPSSKKNRDNFWKISTPGFNNETDNNDI